MSPSMPTAKITIYTDGSSRGNPGPGGYGTLLISGVRRKELSAKGGVSQHFST